MQESSESKSRSVASFFGSIWRGHKSYLTDWRNLLGHALLGVVFVVIAVWAPINIWLKLAIIAFLILFNILRMRLKAKKKNMKESVTQ